MIHEVSTHVISIHGLCLHVLEALVTFFLGFIMALNLPRCVRFMSGDTEFETLETANTMEFLVIWHLYLTKNWYVPEGSLTKIDSPKVSGT